jgi:hypothetical protein
MRIQNVRSTRGKGARLLSASGDSGVGGGSCHTNDGRGSVKYLPEFPASDSLWDFLLLISISNTRD